MKTPVPSLPTPDAPPGLAGLLSRQARERPQAVAWILGEETITFADLLARTERLARDLPAGRVHRTRGDNVHLARHACAARWKNQAFFPVDRDIDLPDVPLPADVSLLIATSGSEGQPRIVLLGDRQLHHAAAAANERLPLHPGDLWLACLPLQHIGGQSILWRTLLAGAGMLLEPGFDAMRIAGALQRHPVTHLSLVPAMLARLLDTGCPPPDCLRHVLVGGAALNPALHARACQAGWPLHPSYGLSETAAQIATWMPEDGPWQPGDVGRPLAGSEIAIGEDGRIRIRSPQRMLGYLGISGEASGIDDDGWLTTGDLGSLDAGGRLRVRGRADDMLISGGRNLHPLEIEAHLAACPGVRDIAVTGLPDPVWGDRIVALLVGDASDERLLAHARRHLPPAAQPRCLLRVAELPRLGNGKLDRAALRRLAAGG